MTYGIHAVPIPDPAESGRATCPTHSEFVIESHSIVTGNIEDISLQIC
jgi:hypothetical protein